MCVIWKQREVLVLAYIFVTLKWHNWKGLYGSSNLVPSEAQWENWTPDLWLYSRIQSSPAAHCPCMLFHWYKALTATLSKWKILLYLVIVSAKCMLLTVCFWKEHGPFPSFAQTRIVLASWQQAGWALDDLQFLPVTSKPLILHTWVPRYH